MDWIKQRSFQNWVIGLLVALNLFVLAVLWTESRREQSSVPRQPRTGGAMSEDLLRQELDLTPDQVEEFKRLRAAQMGGMRSLNEELDSLKLLLADLVFDRSTGGAEAESLAASIGRIQSRLELARYQHFRELAQLCDDRQREMLRPLLREVVGKQGPARRGEPAVKREERREDAGRVRGTVGSVERPPERDVEKPAPPSIAEKLSRYDQRLSLTPPQAAEVEAILKQTRTKEEALKSRRSPDREAFETEKQRLREEEDRRILGVLDPAQRAEFERMIKNRRNPPPRD